MNRIRRKRSMTILSASALSAVLLGLPSLAQDANGDGRDDRTGRLVDNGEPVVLAFNEVQVKDILDFIVQVTGKTVIPADTIVLTQKVTIVNNRPLPRNEALNQLFVAMLERGMGVVETESYVKLAMIANIVQRDCPVLGPNDRLEHRTDEGVIINKIFRPRYASADNLETIVDELIPDDWGRVEIEPEQNAIVVLTSIGIGKKIEKLIDELDTEGIYETRTFLLNYADAQTVAEWIEQLWGASSASATRSSNTRTAAAGRGGFVPGQRPGSSDSGGSAASPSGVKPAVPVADTRNNSVTVIADPEVMDHIEQLIRDFWDVKPEGAIIQIYTLKYRDVVRVRDILSNFSGSSTSSAGAGGATRAIPGQQGGGASGGGATTRLSDLFSFDHDTSANQLIVTAKTGASFETIDQIIQQLDQPIDADLPLMIHLKHADAEELALTVNAIFANPGVRLEIQSQAQDLAAFDPSSAIDSAAGGTGTTGGTGQTQQQGTSNFPWMLDRPDPTRAPESPIVGRMRVMPVLRTNSVLVLGPPHYKSKIAGMIEDMDKPGKQVLISAVIAEVTLDDSTALGIRWSRSDVFGAPTDNQFGASAGFDGTDNSFLNSLFDTTVLDVSANLAVLIEALQTTNNVRVVSQPQVFTHDNQQANFFDGQRIQVVSDSVTDITSGNINSTFEDRLAGIIMSARPRITHTRDVDLQISLELSSLLPQTTAAGGLIFDQRKTETQVVLRDGQTVVISGIMREEDSDIKRKVPFLGDIPLIGALFTSMDKSKVRRELIAFVTPIVVDNADEVDQLMRPWNERRTDLNRPIDELMGAEDGEQMNPWAIRREALLRRDETTTTETDSSSDEAAPPQNDGG